jgi:hypothetical protein|tara:strand:+ start:167 stop:382 length:216 start_codon:yes stop_codon:yes gene_type:complete
MREAHDAALNGAHPAKRQRADDAPTVVPPPDFTHVLVRFELFTFFREGAVFSCHPDAYPNNTPPFRCTTAA